jgi:hypothetical protein
MLTKKVLGGSMTALTMAVIVASPAGAFIHDAQFGGITIRHGLYRGSSLYDGAIQVSDNVATGGFTYQNGLRISLYQSNNRFYDYTCGDSSNCYHNHTGGYAECSYQAANEYYDTGVYMSYHLNHDTDYCG